MGGRYDLVLADDAWQLLFVRPVDASGVLLQTFIPDHLAGVDVGTSNDMNLSTDATGTDASTLYFRTTNGGEIYHGDTRVEEIVLGGNTITAVQHGTDYVYAIPQEVQNFVVSELSNTSASISWDAPLVASEPVTYRLERASNSAFSSGLVSLSEIQTGTTFTSTGLSSGSTYYFRCLLYTSPSPRDRTRSRMPSSA